MRLQKPSSAFHLNDDSGGVIERKAGGEGTTAILMQLNQMADAECAITAVAAVASAVVAKSVRHRQIGERCQREAREEKEEKEEEEGEREWKGGWLTVGG